MLRLAGVAALAVFVSAAPETETPDCADGRCAVLADHSLLQARSTIHNPNQLAAKAPKPSAAALVTRDCAEFGICDEPAPLSATRRSLLEARVESRKAKKRVGEPAFPPANSLVAFDCGSSGSTAAIVEKSDRCAKQLADSVMLDRFEVEHKLCDTKTDAECAAKNDPQPKTSTDPSNHNCNIVGAFASGPFPSPACEHKWDNMAHWAKDLNECFDKFTTCWAAGTAGNRIVTNEADQRGWENFEKWTREKVFMCSNFLPKKYTSNKKSRTIPGTMEAAMEVEEIIAEDKERGTSLGGPNPMVAFGSAGGSSAQFGIRLSSAKYPQEALHDWNAIREGVVGKAFQQANFHSEVDTLPGDYLNTFTATDGSVWAVGSFLGADKCEDKGTTTPIGGISAMLCGLKKLGENPAQYEVQQAMEESAQGKLAAEIKKWMKSPMWSEKMQGNPNAIRCVAKIHTALKQVWKFSGELATHFVRNSYSYMSVLGFLPGSSNPAVSGTAYGMNPAQQKLLQEMDHVSEYAWLGAAVKFATATTADGKSHFESEVTSDSQVTA